MILKTSYPFMKPPPSARLIQGHRLAQGLVFFPPFYENGGEVVYDLVNRYPGTFINNTSWGTGQFGSCLSFDGTGDYVDFGTIQLVEGCSAFSTSVWVKSDLTSTDANRNIINQTGDNDWFFLRWDTGEKMSAFIYTTDDTVEVRTDVDIVDTNWHHWFIIYNGVDVRLYKDNILQTDVEALTGTIETQTDPLIVGEDWDGLIDLPMIWNHALTASERNKIYQNQFCIFERKARIALLSGFAAPPVGAAGIMTTNTGFWGPTF